MGALQGGSDGLWPTKNLCWVGHYVKPVIVNFVDFRKAFDSISTIDRHCGKPRIEWAAKEIRRRDTESVYGLLQCNKNKR